MKAFKPVALIDRAAQVAEYKWDVWTEALYCEDGTTVKDIYEWVKGRTGFGGANCTEVKIVFAEVIVKEVTK